LTKVWTTSSLWQRGDVLVPWKCMLTEAAVMVALRHSVPGGTVMPAMVMPAVAMGLSGTWLVRWTLMVSPGLTCSVGDSWPSSVTKQNRVRPTSSTDV